MMKKIHPHIGDTQTVYLNTVVKDLSIEVGDYTIYNDFVSNPLLFEQSMYCIIIQSIMSD
jgi:virginiamycin A acetyltransferase